MPALEPEEEGSMFGDDDYDPFSKGAPGTEQIEEEKLALVLKTLWIPLWGSRLLGGELPF